MKGVAFGSVGDLVISVFGRQPSAAEWRGFIDFLTPRATHRQRALVIALSGVLDNAQRRELFELLGPHRERDRRIAMVTDSTFTRGFIRALSLVDPTIRPFSPREMDAALRYVEAPPLSLAEIQRRIADFTAEVS